MNRPSLGGVIVPLMTIPGVIVLLCSMLLFLALEGWQAFIVGPLAMMSGSTLLLLAVVPRRHVLAVLIVNMFCTALAAFCLYYFYGGFPEELLPH